MFNGMCYLEELQTNVHLIPERVREIDSDYRIVRNLNTKQFELHHIGQGKKTGNSMCLVLPFDTLDCRTVEYVRKTSVRNRNLLREYREMEEKNRQMEEKKKAEAMEKTSYEAKEILKFCHNSSRDWID